MVRARFRMLRVLRANFRERRVLKKFGAPVASWRGDNEAPAVEPRATDGEDLVCVSPCEAGGVRPQRQIVVVRREHPAIDEADHS